MSVNKGSLLARIHAVFEKPLYQRCSDIDYILRQHAPKDLHSVLPIIIEHIFGFGAASGSSYGSFIGPQAYVTQSEFNVIHDLLGPEGSLLRVVSKLAADSSCRYEFPISCLPFPSRCKIDDGCIPLLYREKLQLYPSGKQCAVLLLDAFEFYMFHFAYFLVNTKAFQCVNTSRRLTAWNSTQDFVYPYLLDNYLNYFLPLDCSNVPLTPPAPVSPPRSYAAECQSNLFTQNWKTSSPPPKNTSSPSGYLSFLLVKPEPLASSSPLGTVVAAADLACTGQETWRAESFLQILVEFYLNQYTSVESCSPLATSVTSSSGEHVRMVRMLVKHLHYFVSSSPARDAPRTMIISQWTDLKRRVWPQYVQRSLYVFLKYNFDYWPLDSMFRMVLETWLSFIQPWRYCADAKQSRKDSHSRSNCELDYGIDEKWYQFIVDNFLFYTVLCRSFIERALRMDLSAHKNAQMLMRMSKVFSLKKLPDILRDIEGSVQDMTTGDHIGGCSMLRHSPGPAFGCRSIGSLAANLTTQFMELEGPRYHYRPLFSIATERVVMQLLQSMAEAAQDVAESLQSANSSDFASESKLAWFFGIGNSIDCNASRYYSADEPYDGEQSRTTAQCHLEQATVNLCLIFQVERPSLEQFNVSGRRVVHDKTGLLPEVEVVDGVTTLTNRGRYQLVNGLRRFEVEYTGDPDLQPIRSYENITLVRILHTISCYINMRYADKIDALYRRDDVIGRLVRPTLEPPMPVTPEKLSLMSPAARRLVESRHGRPRVSLRWLASYQTLGYFLLTYWLLYLWRGSSLLEYCLLMVLFGVVYCIMRAAVVEPTTHATQ